MLRTCITGLKVLRKQSLMTIMLTADGFFFALEAVKLRQRRALCSAACMTENAIEETSIKKQAYLILSSTRFLSKSKQTNKTLGHVEYAHKYHTQSAFQ